LVAARGGDLERPSFHDLRCCARLRANLLARNPHRSHLTPLPCYPASVRSSARKLSTEQELYASALGALMRRAHSIHEMRQYLERRAEDEEIISSVMARLRELRYLDDARYAADYARQRAHSRRRGRFRITRELRGRGVCDRFIEAALDAVFSETDEAALVRARLRRSLSHLRGPLDPHKIASLYRSLLRAGFSADTIRTELRLALRTGEADVASRAEPDASRGDPSELPEPPSEDG
jgi:SOS response regulatory protein OraA/RecX